MKKRKCYLAMIRNGRVHMQRIPVFANHRRKNRQVIPSRNRRIQRYLKSHA